LAQACYEDHNDHVGCKEETLGAVNLIGFFCCHVGMVVCSRRSREVGESTMDHVGENDHALVICREVKVIVSNAVSSVEIYHGVEETCRE
jgi:hypothetical protein